MSIYNKVTNIQTTSHKKHTDLLEIYKSISVAQCIMKFRFKLLYGESKLPLLRFTQITCLSEMTIHVPVSQLIKLKM